MTPSSSPPHSAAGSPPHQIPASPRHQVPASPPRQVPASPRHQVPASPPHQAPASPPPEPLSPAHFPITLSQPSSKQPRRPASKAFRILRSVIRSFPILTPAACRFHPSIPRGTARPHDGHISGAARTTGTLFGHRKGRITLAVQDTPRSIPILLLELAIPTSKFIQEMSTGLLRLALECDKRPDKGKLLEEPVWTAFVNGRKIGGAARREATETDLVVMQMLHAVSMGAGVLPGDMTHPVDGELTYMRAHFDRVMGSKDSETFYMLNPDEKTGPELSIFFVRV